MYFEAKLHDFKPQVDERERTKFPKSNMATTMAVLIRSDLKQDVRFLALHKAYLVTCYDNFLEWLVSDIFFHAFQCLNSNLLNSFTQWRQNKIFNNSFHGDS